MHGAGLSGMKTAPLLVARLDKAVEPREADYRRAAVIASGGQGVDEAVSEAEAMRTCLVEDRGVPVDAAIEEGRSAVDGDPCNSKTIMDARSGAHRVAVVIGDYHVFLTAECAHKSGLTVDGVGSRSARPRPTSQGFMRPCSRASLIENIGVFAPSGALVLVYLGNWCRAAAIWPVSSSIASGQARRG